ncbi:hypothetical protein V6N13_082491 [Hibiscus sabdariffa]|uniref:Uncharacterized protein n=1 Tax=Hibiscus sabdariffa TaxID=183260 RepID=A0ABR2Q497_9ROSI
MQSLAAPSHLLPSSTHRQLPPSSSRSTSTSTTTKSNLPSQNPKPQKPTHLPHSLTNPFVLASASAATLLITVTPISSCLPGGGGDNSGGFSGGGWSGGGGSNGGNGSSGNFWEKLFSPRQLLRTITTKTKIGILTGYRPT